MQESAQPVYFIEEDDAGCILRIEGRASYLNCAPVGHALTQALNKKVPAIFIDFQHCQGMDSTFLGTLANICMEGMEANPSIAVNFLRLKGRNRETLENLGLHHIGAVVEDTCELPLPSNSESSSAAQALEAAAGASKADILHAHKKLIQMDSNNAAKFKDVVAYLESELEGGESS